jgi:uncharacterized protein
MYLLYKKTAALVLCLMLSLGSAAIAVAESPEVLNGRWSGSFTVGHDTVRQIVFNIHSVDGAYSATLDMPAQGSAGITVDSVAIKGDEITLVIKAVQAEFYGTLRWTDAARTEVARIDGDWNQVGEYVAFSLYRDNKS